MQKKYNICFWDIIDTIKSTFTRDSNYHPSDVYDSKTKTMKLQPNILPVLCRLWIHRLILTTYYGLVLADGFMLSPRFCKCRCEPHTAAVSWEKIFQPTSANPAAFPPTRSLIGPRFSLNPEYHQCSHSCWHCATSRKWLKTGTATTLMDHFWTTSVYSATQRDPRG